VKTKSLFILFTSEQISSPDLCTNQSVQVLFNKLFLTFQGTVVPECENITNCLVTNMQQHPGRHKYFIAL